MNWQRYTEFPKSYLMHNLLVDDGVLSFTLLAYDLRQWQLEFVDLKVFKFGFESDLHGSMSGGDGVGSPAFTDTSEYIAEYRRLCDPLTLHDGELIHSVFVDIETIIEAVSCSLPVIRQIENHVHGVPPI